MFRKLLVLATAALLFFLVAGMAAAEETEYAEDITAVCKIKTCSSPRKPAQMTDGKYTSYWESNKVKNPWVTVTSDTPVYGLYLCFREMPESYEIQIGSGDSWRTVFQGDTRFHHMYYELDGVHTVRIFCTEEKTRKIGFNEIFVFGEGEVPDWVQRWEPTVEKADILFLVAHPDDELIFLGGAIPTYAVEQGKSVAVAYLSWSNTTRRSEALNGLWTMGVRNYPVFGGFRDAYASDAKKAYKNVTGNLNEGKRRVYAWITELFRRYRPEVVVTHDLNGEYGHGQHKMVADAATACFDRSGDAVQDPETAETYGLWQVKKLYIHLYGDTEQQTRFDWDIPLKSMDGKTGKELAEAAYALHKTQIGAEAKIHGKNHRLSVALFGGPDGYDNTKFGLYASIVGEDSLHTDFLENIPE